jgi:predicted porin
MFKKIVIAGALATAVAGSALAQSNVTIYGIIDAAVRQDTQANSSDQSRTSMISGGQSTSRLGFQGTEDLGNGLSAKFMLESGFNTNTGANSQNGTGGTVLFDRAAWVGLADKTLGEIQIGRNTNAGNDLAAAGITDPLKLAYDGVGAPVNAGNSTYGVSAMRVNQAVYATASTNGLKNSRSNGMIKYVNNIGPVGVIAGYAPGGVTGDESANSSYNAGLTYVKNNVKLGGAYFRAEDAANRAETNYSLGGAYTLGKATLSLAHYNVKTDAGYVAGNLTTTATYGGPVLGLTTTAGPSTTANINSVGVEYRFTPAVNTTLAVYDGKYSNGVGSNGNYTSYVLFNTYALSKRTNLYASVDFGKTTGALSQNVSDTNTGVMAGLRHRF